MTQFTTSPDGIPIAYETRGEGAPESSTRNPVRVERPEDAVLFRNGTEERMLPPSGRGWVARFSPTRKGDPHEDR